MSTKLERDLDNFLYFDGAYPNLAEGVNEVPLPQGFYYCRDCGATTNHWELGRVCSSCEQRGEEQMEMARGN